MLRLAVAVELAFPGAGMKVSALRREAARGHLAIYRIAGKDFTTLAAIEKMRTLCLVQAKEPTSGSEKQDQTNPDALAKPQDGSSKTADANLALAAARESVKKLKEGLAPTSPQNTRRRGGNVISPKFGSPT
jgi:hypothetical protein